MSLIERSIKRRLDAGEPISDAEWEIWYEYHPECKPQELVEAEKLASDPAYIPDIEVNERIDDDLQPFLDGIDLLDAYERWSGKNFTPKVGSKRESIMISCPVPGHADANPSAWINLDKQVWFCAKCDTGGDKYEIAAYHHNFPVPEYKRNGDFPKLRRQMVEDFGGLISRTPGGKELVISPEPSTNGKSHEEPSTDAEIVQLSDFEPDEQEYDTFLVHGGVRIDWESIVPPQSFLYEWMHSVAVTDDVPHEYYFWLGLQALGAAVGRDVWLNDRKPVYPNLLVCLYGRSSTGKTRSTDPFFELLNEALPYTYDPSHASKGVVTFQSIGSSEALMEKFSHNITDLSTGAVTGQAPVRGLFFISEFSAFIAKALATKSPMKDTLMDLYDGRTTSHSTRTTGALSVTDPFCMCVTTTQPKAIHAYLSRKDADSGFLNRWIFATGVRRRDRIAWHAGPPDINSAVEMLKSIHAWSGTPREMFIRDEAMEVWKKRFLGEIVPLQEGGADDSMIGRLDLHIKKIILLLTINQQLDQPTAEIVEQAFSVLPYLISTARLIDKALSYTDQEECQNLILDLIKRHSEKVSGGPTIRQLSQSVGKKFTREQIERALKTLEVLDLIVPHKSQGTRGPQTKRYQLNA